MSRVLENNKTDNSHNRKELHMDTYTKHYYTAYCDSEDKTFIMCETSKNREYISIAVVGFHFGKPYDDSLKFIGECTFNFNW